ncbi:MULTISPECIES: dihydrofolate reductase family protein [Filomicrobium]|uniref:Dihydrofolate reductase n=1 Tax=Filomicrobium insigne TaxID=418854 RepID=A0A1H0MQY8_9HYPH|nr:MULTISPECIES: dihydrofolate reductase family protein [Filomicrobium]MCV0369090.1 dihydrofolate reductase family protein [Filomicrobium sp.]SDO82859.1 Dihydrofolate reductase [Filomicrobium insigne]
MAKVRLYAATSLDGFIADNTGDTDWLLPYQGSIFGTGFMGEVGAVILGRRTYQIMQAFNGWPYAGKRAYVLSSSQISSLPENTMVVKTGIGAAVEAARCVTTQDIWVVGGALTMQSALEADLVDLVEICVAPVLLGAGLTMLMSLERRADLYFDGIQTFENGVVKLRYVTKR